jgi:hypothetical protein
VTKLDYPAKAIELYKGVMYSTLAKHLRRDAPPSIVILSAEHGFISPERAIAPYNRRMTAARADELISELEGFVAQEVWPSQVGSFFLAGGAEYRRVMRAMLVLLCPEAAAFARETSGSIGQQRAQLGAFLRGCAQSCERVGATISAISRLKQGSFASISTAQRKTYWS